MYFKDLIKTNKLLFSYGFIEGVSKGLNLLTILCLGIFASINIYSQLALFIICELLLVELILFGQQNVALRFINVEEKSVENVLSSCTKIIFTVFIFIFLVSYLIPAHLFIDIFKFDIKSNFLLLIIGSFFTALINLNLYGLRKEDKLKPYSSLRLVFQSFKFLFVVVLIFLYDNSAIYPISIIFSSLLAIIFSTFKFQVFSYLPQIFKIHYKFKYLSFGIPLMLNASAGILYSQLDKIVLNALIGAEELAIYHFNLTLGTASFFIVNVSALYFTPKIYISDSYNDLSKKYLNNFLKISIVGAILTSLIIIFMLYPLISFFLPNEYLSGKNILYLGCFYIILSCFSSYAVYKGTAMNKVHIIPIVKILTLLLAIILNFYLIPIFLLWCNFITHFLRIFFSLFHC